ncbi:MAG: hypothetical protein QOH84_1982 [Kribbellaceae bacterium]|nr:hypothetical protein [Kribbellaceae bacterium]
MTDPFQFFTPSHQHDGPVYRAPDDAIESWQKLAEEVRRELERMGFPASVVPGGDPQGLPPGAHIWVNTVEPFGVTIDWDPPVTGSPEYVEKVLTQDVTSGLFSYVVNASEIIVRALVEVLREAGFKVLIDHAGGRTYNYRVLSAPRFPKF